MDTIAGRLPYTDDLHRLLKAVDSYPIREPHRVKLLRAIDLLESERWTRVVVTLDSPDLALLQIGRRTIEGELGDVLGYAETIAKSYGFPRVDVGLVAVAIAASARAGEQQRLRLVNAVAEAFIGGLAQSEQILTAYPAKLYVSDDRRLIDDSPDTRSRVVWNHVEGHDRALQRLRLVDLVLRWLSVLLLVVVSAVSSAHWWAWLFLPVPFMATRSSLEQWPSSVERVPKRVLTTGAPLVLIAAMGAEFAGLPVHGALLGLTALVLDIYDAWAERRQVGWAQRKGPEIRSLGQGQQVVAGLLQVPERVMITGRIRRLRAVWIPAVVFGFLFMHIAPLWVPAALLAALMAQRRLIVTTATTVGFALLHVPAGLILLALFTGAAGAVADGVVSRFPLRRTPVRWMLSRRAFLHGLAAQWRIRHALARDQVGAALVLVRRAQRAGLEQPLAPLLAWAVLRANRPGEAIRLVQTADARHRPTTRFIELFANLDLGHRARADQLALELKSPGPGRKQPAAMSLELLARSGSFEQSEADVRALLPALAVATHRSAAAGRPLETVRLLRACSAVCAPIAPAVAIGLVEDAVRLAHMSQQRTTAQSRARASLGASGTRMRPLTLEFMLGALTQQELEVRLLGDALPVRKGANLREAAAFLFEFDRPFETATTLARVADLLQDLPGLRLDALELRLTALASFNVVRHDLTDPDERLRWFQRFNEQLEKAMSQAARGQDWATLAELLETARLQASPGTSASEPWPTDLTAPFIRVRTQSRLENSPVQVVNPVAYDLESIATLTLGPDTWWWSSWATDTLFYWSLVPPVGSTHSVSGGVRPLGEVRDTVAQLREALPGFYPGERKDQRDARLARSALLHGPRGAERRLMAAATQLLPGPLLSRLAAATEAQPMLIAIAPAPVLAPVPWNALPIGGGDIRLVELARIVVAPPAALLASIAARPRLLPTPDSAPIAGAVVNPGGDLKFADPLTAALPGNALVLEKRPGGHPASALLDLLKAVPRASTFVFAGHTLPPAANERAASLYLGALDGAAEEDPTRVLSASMLLHGEVSLPEQVIALACASSDIASVEAGEWTTLGPALLWAGADRAVLTSYPIVDTAEFDSSLIDTSRPLYEVLRAAQLDRLEAWRDTGEDGAPVHWAGHIALGIFNPDAEALPPQRGSTDIVVAPALFEMLDHAAQWAERHRDGIIRASDLRLMMILYGWHDNVPVSHLPLTKLVVGIIRLVAMARAVVAIARRKLTRSKVVMATQIDSSLAELLHATRVLAIRSRHHRIDTEHLLVAALQARGWHAAFARLITGWNPLIPETERALLEEYNPDAHIWEPNTKRLAAEGIEAIEAALGVRSSTNQPDTESDGELGRLTPNVEARVQVE